MQAGILKNHTNSNKSKNLWITLTALALVMISHGRPDGFTSTPIIAVGLIFMWFFVVSTAFVSRTHILRLEKRILIEILIIVILMMFIPSLLDLYQRRSVAGVYLMIYAGSILIYFSSLVLRYRQDGIVVLTQVLLIAGVIALVAALYVNVLGYPLRVPGIVFENAYGSRFGRLHGTFASANRFADSQAIGVLAGFSAIVLGKKKSRLWSIIGTIIVGVGLLLSGSKSAIGGTLVALSLGFPASAR